MHTLKLIRPTQEYADQVMAYRQEMLDNGDTGWMCRFGGYQQLRRMGGF